MASINIAHQGYSYATAQISDIWSIEGFTLLLAHQNGFEGRYLSAWVIATQPRTQKLTEGSARDEDENCKEGTANDQSGEPSTVGATGPCSEIPKAAASEIFFFFSTATCHPWLPSGERIHSLPCSWNATHGRIWTQRPKWTPHKAHQSTLTLARLWMSSITRSLYHGLFFPLVGLQDAKCYCFVTEPTPPGHCSAVQPTNSCYV